MNQRKNYSKNELATDKKSVKSGPSSLVTDSPTLRYNEFLEELDGGIDLTAELLDGFVIDTSQRISEAEKALNSGDMKRLHLEAHSIKGGALNLMADNLAECALGLEQSAGSQSSGDENLIHNLKELKMAFKRFTEAWNFIRESNETDQG